MEGEEGFNPQANYARGFDGEGEGDGGDFNYNNNHNIHINEQYGERQGEGAFPAYEAPEGPLMVEMAAYDVDDIMEKLAIVEEEEHQELAQGGLGYVEIQQIKELYHYKKTHLISQLPEQAQRRHKRQSRDPDGGGGRADGGGSGMGVDVQKRPWFSWFLAAFLLVVFLYQLKKADWTFDSKNPLYGPSTTQLVDMGAKLGPKITDDGQWWRLATSMFLHAGIVHYVMNVAFIIFWGSDIERAFGWRRVSVIYITSGIFGMLLSAIFLPQIATVGASSALFGLIGALFGDFWHNHAAIRVNKCKYMTGLVVTSVICLGLGLMPMLDNFAHIGGWFCGIICGLAFLGGVTRDANGHKIQSTGSKICQFVSIILLLALYVFGIAMLYQYVDVNCSFCNSLSCLETDFWDCNICVEKDGNVTCKPLGSA